MVKEERQRLVEDRVAEEQGHEEAVVRVQGDQGQELSGAGLLDLGPRSKLDAEVNGLEANDAHGQTRRECRPQDAKHGAAQRNPVPCRLEGGEAVLSLGCAVVVRGAFQVPMRVHSCTRTRQRPASGLKCSARDEGEVLPEHILADLRVHRPSPI